MRLLDGEPAGTDDELVGGDREQRQPRGDQRHDQQHEAPRSGYRLWSVLRHHAAVATTPAASGWRPANGWSTCATGSRSPPDTWPAPLNFGLDGSFATYLGWLIPWGHAGHAAGGDRGAAAAAQRELVRIGVDWPAAHATGAPADWSGGDEPATFPRATFADPSRSATTDPSCS